MAALMMLGWACTSLASAVDGEVKVAKLSRGFSYTNEVDPRVPWSIHVVKVDRAHPEMRLTTSLGDGEFLGMGLLSEQIRHFPRDLGQPVAAVNGDFYHLANEYAGRPRDLQIRAGELVTHPAGHTCFWIDAMGQPHMTNVYSRFRVVWPDGGTLPFYLNAPCSNDTVVLYTAVIGKTTAPVRGLEYVLERVTEAEWLPLRIGKKYEARVREVRRGGNSPVTKDTLVLSVGQEVESGVRPLQPGMVVKLCTETLPEISGAEMAIGGGPTLIMEGKAMSCKDWLLMRHPRSAVGFNDKHYFLVEVDGRQIDVSLGMTFPELQDLMLRLGCDYAMNFDGGGSAALWVLGDVRSSPSEGQERPAANALVVVKKAAHRESR